MAAIIIYRDDTTMSAGLKEINRRLGESMSAELLKKHPRDAQGMQEREKSLQRASELQADLILARDIVQAHCDDALVKTAREQARSKKNPSLPLGVRLRARGREPVHIRLQNGLVLTMLSPYMLPKRMGKAKNNPQSYTGTYPVLELLGITKHATPAPREHCARQIVLCDSYEEAQEQLARDGLMVHIETMLLLALYMGNQALELQKKAFDDAISAPLLKTSPLQGLRIQISIDGGRIRTRTTDTEAPIGKNKRRPFSSTWREPRLITLTVLNKKGKQDRNIRPIYVASMGTADEVMRQAVGLLRYLGAHLAQAVVFVCDGAKWLWSRMEAVAHDAGLLPSRVFYVLDFWHACEYVNKALTACKNMNKDDREALYQELRLILRDEEGGVERVIARLKKLAVGRRAKEVNSRISYLNGHIEHMRYATMRKMNLSIGSGTVESTVKRVVNMRFKSASKFWRAEHLEPLMTLRAILKSGRWDDFCRAELMEQFWLSPSFEPLKSQKKNRLKAA